MLRLALFYFWEELLEDYCKWQSIHYLDGSSRVGEGWFQKALDCDMCATIAGAGSEESFPSKIDPAGEGTCSSSWQRLLRHLTLTKTDGADSDRCS